MLLLSLLLGENRSKEGVNIKSRKDLCDIFNISYKGLIRIEKELSLFDTKDLTHKKFSKQMVQLIKQHIDTNYLLPEDTVEIEDTNCYINNHGDIYKTTYSNGLFYKAKQDVNHEYSYCRIKGKNKRVHRLVAENFIPNPHGYDIVMHIDNNKLNNDFKNLMWGNISMNSQQAHDDGLVINLKGYEDCQSMPVHMFSMSGEVIKSYGSISIAAKENNIPKSTIARQCKKNSSPRNKKYYFRYQKDNRQ